MGYISDAMDRGKDNQADKQPDKHAGAAKHSTGKIRAPKAMAGDSVDDSMDDVAGHVPADASDSLPLSKAETTAAEVVAGDAAWSHSTSAHGKPMSRGLAPANPPIHEKLAEGIDERLVALTAPSSVMAEEYRSIRTSLLARIKHKRHLVHMITSATPQEGKTFTSLNLGFSLAELRNRRTLVIEADLRLPQFQKLLQLPEGPGLVAYLRDETDLASTIRPVGPRGLHVISAGDRVNDQAVDLLSRPKMQDLLRMAREHYDHVIIDTPPVIELADAGIVGRMSDEVMLIIRMNRTPRELVQQAMRALQQYDAPLCGAIATDDSRHRGKYYSYRYGYRYGYRYSQYTRQAA